MTQGEIIGRYKTQLGARDLRSVWRVFVERMDYMTPTYATFCNWYNNSTEARAQSLKFARSVYLPDDWRYQMAGELLEAIVERAR